jgi:hypothetical protein
VSVFIQQSHAPEARVCKHADQKTQNEQAIIILELVLYMLFGVVQLIQGFFPNGNRKIEASYILLSLFAKFFLGVMLFANVMFT